MFAAIRRWVIVAGNQYLDNDLGKGLHFRNWEMTTMKRILGLALVAALVGCSDKRHAELEAEERAALKRIVRRKLSRD